MFGRNGHGIMPNRSDSMADSGEPVIYQIRLKGHLGRRWTDWFEGLTITHEEGGGTLLTRPVEDQAALHGLLRRVRDLGISVVRSEKGGHTGQDRKR